MKNIAIFRVAFQPSQNRELTAFLMGEIAKAGERAQIAVPTPFGVLSILTTEKTEEQVKEALLLNFPNLNFQIFEVTPEGIAQNSNGNPHASSTMDDLLTLIQEVGGFDNLPQTAKDRLHHLSGGQ